MTTIRNTSTAQPPVAMKDASVRAAFNSLDARGGTVSAAALRNAILRGTGDRDGRAATVEYSDVMRWVAANKARLSPEARRVVAVFARFARQARAQGRTGIPLAQVSKMSSMMSRVAKGSAHRPEPKPAAEPRPAAQSKPAAEPKRAAEPRPAAQSKPTAQSKDDFRSTSRSGAESVVHDARNRWFISQFDSKWNTNEDAARNGNCGPTSILMAANAFGKVNVTPSNADRLIEDARRRAGAGTNEYRGIGVETMARGVRSYGLNTRVEMNTSLADIKRELSKGRLVLVNVAPLYFGSHWRNGGHMTVVTAIKDGKVYLNDPGTTRGPKVITEAQFMAAVRRRQQISGSLGSPQGMVSVWP